MKKAADSAEAKIRINTVVIGEPAKWLNDWKKRGLVTSYADAIIQALRFFNEKITDQDLKSAQLENVQRISDF